MRALSVRRYFRPEEANPDVKPIPHSFWELYRGTGTATVAPQHVVRPCKVLHGHKAQHLLVDYGPSVDTHGRDTFVCLKGWDASKRQHVALPEDILYKGKYMVHNPRPVSRYSRNRYLW